jgi:protein TonB
LQTLREAVGARRAEQRGDAQPFTGARAAIARARGCAEIGAFAAALRYVDEALALDPGNSEATALKEELKARSAPPPPTFVEPKAVATPPPDVHSGVRSRVRGLMIGGTIAIALLAAVAIGWYFRQPDTTPRDAGVGISPAAQPTAVAPVPTPAPTAVKVAKPVAVGGDIPEPQKWRDVAPIHPPSARAKGAYGTVMLEITIAPNGRVSDTRVVKSIPLLDEAAQEAARQWQYAPTLVDGSPVAVVMTVPVSFAREQAAARGERATPSGGEGRRDSAPTFDADAALRRAQASMARQEFASALEDFQAVLSRQPENAAAQEGIAQIAERRNRADRFVRQATALFSDGDYDGATTNANRALDAYPGHVEATALLKKVQTAKDAEQALKRKPGGRD